MCLSARQRNSTGSQIFADSKSDLSRVAHFPTTGKGKEDSGYKVGFQHFNLLQEDKCFAEFIAFLVVH